MHELTVSIVKKIGCPHTTIALEEIANPVETRLRGLRSCHFLKPYIEIGTTEAGMSAD